MLKRGWGRSLLHDLKGIWVRLLHLRGRSRRSEIRFDIAIGKHFGGLTEKLK
jgi:hypothetical protein